MTPLSPAERQVLHLAAEGLECRWIAAVRQSSPKTVRTQLERTRLKLEALNTTHAVAIAIRDGQL